jgi:hypothetical protein
MARMLSADPTIPEPGNLQAYSRYAYVFNDPINRWDPSGYKPKWGQLLAGIIIGALTQQWYLVNFGAGTAPVAAAGWVSAEGAAIVATSGFTTGSLVTAGALGGFAGGLVSSGGDLRSAAAGALTVSMFGFAGALGQAGNVSGQMAMHAAAGCVSGALGGGGAEGCARGAIAQSFSKMVTIETRTLLGDSKLAHGIAASVSGGTASAMMGGKFANGAMTGAFGYLFNQIAAAMKAELFNTRRFHEYVVVGKICDFSNASCFLENAKTDFGLNSWPGSDGTNPAKNGAIRFARDGWLPGGFVTQEVSASGLTVTNHTTPFHFLHQGSITRHLYAGPDGIYVSTIGQGWGPFQQRNIDQGSDIFRRLDTQTRNAFCRRNGGC